MTNVIYILLIIIIPSPCRDVIDEWQIFIDADFNENTGYGGGYEYIIRQTNNEPSLDLLDWQQLQNNFNETVDLDSWTNGLIIRNTNEGNGPGGWGNLIGFAKGSWLSGDEQINILIPEILRGRYRFEGYINGKWICTH